MARSFGAGFSSEKIHWTSLHGEFLLIAEPQHLEHGNFAVAPFVCAQKSLVTLVPHLAGHLHLFTSFDRVCFAPFGEGLARFAKEQWTERLDEQVHQLVPLVDELLYCVPVFSWCPA